MEFIWDIGTVQSYLAWWRKRVNFGNGVAKILTKSMREETQVMWWVDLNFGKPIAEILAAQLLGEVPAWRVAERKPIVATKLPKF